MSTVIEGVYKQAGKDDKLLPVVTDSSGNLRVAPVSNITTKFREAFEDYLVNSPTARWVESKADGDITIADGNAVAASYLVLSKSPWNANTVTTVTSLDKFAMPFDFSIGMHTSQRALGQEFAVEFVDDEVLPAVEDLAISSMTHASGLLTVNTVNPHGLVCGKRIQIAGCSDNRFNYPALVVASIPTPNQFTVTAGPMGTLGAITGTATNGSVIIRSSLGYATNGTSMLFENAVATNASFYIRSAEGDSLPSGTATGSHSTTILTSASSAAITAPNTYAFQPATEYRLALQADRVQWSNNAVDSISQATNVLSKSQVVPDSGKAYKFRIRATSAADLSRPIGKIISAVKSGSTTATITLDRDHGLAVGALVTVYGIRDSAAAAFPNIATATAITGVPASNQIQIVNGTGTANTSYGGFVAVVNGGNLPSALGASAQTVQQATLTTLSDGSRQLILIGSANWAAPTSTVGDYVEVIGVRDNVDGTDMLVDGAWKISSASTTTMTLVPVLPDMVLPADFAATACGGGLMKRTDLRVSFVRIFDFERERVELLSRPVGDLSSAAPVTVQGTAAISGTVTAAAGTSLIGDTATQYRSTASGASATHIVAAATTNPTIIKASAGKVLGWYFANPTAAWVYVKLHNQTTAPTAGTGVVRTIAVPPNGVSQFFSEGGVTFTAGIGMTVVGGAADADNTAVAAAALVGDLIWA